MPGTALPAWAEDFGGGVFAVDTGFQRECFDAAYLLVGDGRAAFVDTGTNHALPRLLGLLETLGLAREAVEAVVPTHVHLDHAGGAGALMQALPKATLWVHPRGARHLIDPSRLYASALGVYGQAEMDRSYGRLVPVAAERVRTTADGLQATIAGRALRFIDTPGHARHHHCIWDEATRGWFTGDTFGLSYREFDTAQGAWITPTCTPVQFEPELLAGSIRRLVEAGPDCIYLTHYGRVRDVPRLAALLLAQLDEIVAIGQRHADAPDRHARLRDDLMAMMQRRLAAHGCTLPAATVETLLALDAELNAQGLAVWLDRERPPAT
jgi:glyoxylase-like metal-dependent hydrolase (beta-lactamase superfamily II)